MLIHTRGQTHTSTPVLLDEFVNTVGAIKESKNEAISQSRDCVLDPLLERLAHFNTSQDLSSPIRKSSLRSDFYPVNVLGH
jgi:hypothetical protein